MADTPQTELAVLQAMMEKHPEIKANLTKEAVHKAFVSPATSFNNNMVEAEAIALGADLSNDIVTPGDRWASGHVTASNAKVKQDAVTKAVVAVLDNSKVHYTQDDVSALATLATKVGKSVRTH